jgi:hypothetical protein
MDNKKRVQNAAAIGSTAGLTVGLIYAFKSKKKFWGYVGYGLLFSLIGSGVASLGAYGYIATMKKAEPKPVIEENPKTENDG